MRTDSRFSFTSFCRHFHFTRLIKNIFSFYWAVTCAFAKRLFSLRAARASRIFDLLKYKLLPAHWIQWQNIRSQGHLIGFPSFQIDKNLIHISPTSVSKISLHTSDSIFFRFSVEIRLFAFLLFTARRIEFIIKFYIDERFRFLTKGTRAKNCQSSYRRQGI